MQVEIKRFHWRASVFGHSFAYITNLVFSRDICIAALACRRATNSASHLPVFVPIISRKTATVCNNQKRNLVK